MPKEKDYTVVAYGLTGMNNLKKSADYFLDDTKRITPHTVLNADAYDDGVVVMRNGFKLEIPLTKPHSLWGGSSILCVSQGMLYQLEGTTPIPICAVPGPTFARLEYVELMDRVYMSNGYWKKILELTSGDTRDWGLTLPSFPEFDQVAGILPPGKYKLCYTRAHTASRTIGGNGPIAEVEWEGGMASLKLKNKPADCLVWITEPNGSELFLAPVTSDGTVSIPFYNRPLPTFGVEAPPPLRGLCFAHGRMWGGDREALRFCEEFRAEQFQPNSVFEVTEDIVLIAPVQEGLFVNSLETTWLLKGRDPAKMEKEKVGDGAIPGSLTFTQVEGAGYEISKKLSQLPSPVWATRKGFVVGTATGHVVHLTESRLRINPLSRAASLSRVVEGRPQTLITLLGSPVGVQDEALSEDFTRGRIFVPAPVEMTLNGGVILDGEGEFA